MMHLILLDGGAPTSKALERMWRTADDEKQERKILSSIADLREIRVGTRYGCL